ncbi:CYTH and CHAD domain-containing protein [Amycolatopsis sp. H20-H5]|uniref:CYTH and CHAD domain-containing protein n=1 Tax=Amycolatopsis sp. H20-H5 TaxID=3046309 RepID=UPI002DBAF5DC|nr:CYTH and CHAD domain-containing protein [Amycolatopsis sp. H20-H5]MEC3976710.1 CYTH and CHAD domain-containing protein [Amycolatopsis sp. H20-H5]
MTRTRDRAPAAEAEIERKYELGHGRPVPALAPVGPVTGRAEPRETLLDASYFDTRDHRLARAGITLRRRSGGGDDGWHLKLPVSEDRRDELSLPLTREQDAVPRRLTRLVKAYTLDRKLVPIASLRTRRTSYDLVDDRGAVLATMTDDVVTGEVGGAAAHLDHWRELEIELSRGADPGLLDLLDSAARAAGAERSRWPSKLRRLMGEQVPGKVCEGKARAGDVLVAYLREQVEALGRNDVGVRRGTADSVHQLRVAARRLRSALKSFPHLLDRAVTRPLAEELKWLGGTLGPARDTEVMAALLRAELAELAPELVLGSVDRSLTRHFAREAEEARDAALRALDSKRYTRLLRALDELVERPPVTRRGRRGTKELRHGLVKAERKLRRSVSAADGAEQGRDLDVALHEVRKKAKQARYAADALRPVTGRKLGEWRKGVKALQSTLGEHHDTVVARDVLRLLGIKAYADGDNGFTFGLLHGLSTGRSGKLRREFVNRWRSVHKGPRPEWLG